MTLEDDRGGLLGTSTCVIPTNFGENGIKWLIMQIAQEIRWSQTIWLGALQNHDPSNCRNVVNLWTDPFLKNFKDAHLVSESNIKQKFFQLSQTSNDSIFSIFLVDRSSERFNLRRRYTKSETKKFQPNFAEKSPMQGNIIFFIPLVTQELRDPSHFRSKIAINNRPVSSTVSELIGIAIHRTRLQDSFGLAQSFQPDALRTILDRILQPRLEYLTGLLKEIRGADEQELEKITNSIKLVLHWGYTTPVKVLTIFV